MAENRYVLEVKRDTFAHLLNECRKNGEFTDVQLQIADKLFDAHRVVLSLYSPVLKAAISDQWSTTKVCPLSDQYVDVEIVEDLLSFLYTGRIELTPENIQPICVAAHFLQISTLLEPSVGYLCKLITTENVLSLFRLSLSFELQELRKSCLQVIKNNYIKVFADSQILEFSSRNFEDFIVGLKEQICGSVQREHTFDCIVRWTEKNLLERLECLPSLLENIPLEELPSQFLAETVSTHPLVKTTSSCAPVVLEAISNYQVYSRTTTQTLVCFSRKFDDSNIMETIRYDSHSRTWKKLSSMFLSRMRTSTAVINQRDIIVCGGILCNSPYLTDSVEMFEWSSQTWTELPKMPLQIFNAGIAILDGCLYLAGGRGRYENNMFENKVLRYCFDQKQWEFVKSMQFNRVQCQLIAHKNHLYAMGGDTNTVERYDPVQNEWTNMAQIECRGENIELSATLHNEKIYVQVCGEYLGVYDPETNIYNTLAGDLPDDGFFLVSMDRKLLAVGGIDNHLPIYEFDFATRQMIEIGQLEPEMDNLDCAVVTNW